MAVLATFTVEVRDDATVGTRTDVTELGAKGSQLAIIDRAIDGLQMERNAMIRCPVHRLESGKV